MCSHRLFTLFPFQALRTTNMHRANQLKSGGTVICESTLRGKDLIPTLVLTLSDIQFCLEDQCLHFELPKTLLFLHTPCWKITIDFLKKLNQTVVVYYLRKRPGKSGWKVKGVVKCATQLLNSFYTNVAIQTARFCRPYCRSLSTSRNVLKVRQLASQHQQIIRTYLFDMNFLKPATSYLLGPIQRSFSLSCITSPKNPQAAMTTL